MLLDLEDQAFIAAAQRWLESLDDATVGDWQALVALSPGYYPSTLHELWRQELLRRGIEATPSKLQIAPASGSSLPVCHPADSEWRFTFDTGRELIARATQSAEPGSCIAHIGSPSTFIAGVRYAPGYRHVLFEKNSAVIDALATSGYPEVDLYRLDLSTTIPPALAAASAIIDPPWYVNDTLIFLMAAVSACRPGTVLWLCQPTEATRPGVAEERIQIETQLPQLGLMVEKVEYRLVRYLTPHFEAKSLQHGLPLVPVPTNWRVGDLLRLRLTGAEAPPAFVPDREGSKWREVRLGPVRIKLRETDAAEDLAPLVAGDVLQTVSRRDPLRERIGFWTSGNRAYSLVNAESVASLIKLCDGDLGKSQFTLARMLDHAERLGVALSTASRLFDVLLLELREHMATQER